MPEKGISLHALLTNLKFPPTGTIGAASPCCACAGLDLELRGPAAQCQRIKKRSLVSAVNYGGPMTILQVVLVLFILYCALRIQREPARDRERLQRPRR